MSRPCNSQPTLTEGAHGQLDVLECTAKPFTGEVDPREAEVGDGCLAQQQDLGEVVPGGVRH